VVGVSDVVIVGGGVGGLMAAIRLRTAGHDVTIIERLEKVGGKLAPTSVTGTPSTSVRRS